MDALIERAAGLDVHQGSVVACIILGAAGRRPTKEVRRFGTMRQDLAALRAWLLEKGITHVGRRAQVSTGSRCTLPWRTPSP
jgi:transposase